MKLPIPREYKHIRPVDQVWYGEPHLKSSLIVPEISIQYGSLLSKVINMPSYAKYLIGSLRELSKSVKSIERNPYLGKTHMSEADLAEITARAKACGITDIGFVTLTEQHLFNDSIALFKSAIVFTMEMKASEIAAAPSQRSNQEVFRTYHELGKTVNLLADFMREKGYNAQPIPAISSNLNLSVMARDAGLGGFGKNGLLITKSNGPSVRLAALLTDVENLPESRENTCSWIKAFCKTCNACVRKCPANAIYDQPIVFEDGSESHIDYKKCAVPFTKQHGCTLCIKECTFFKKDYQTLESVYLGKK